MAETIKLLADKARSHHEAGERARRESEWHASARADAIYRASFLVPTVAELARVMGTGGPNATRLIAASPLRERDLETFVPALKALGVQPERLYARRLALLILKLAAKAADNPSEVARAVALAERRLNGAVVDGEAL